MKLTNEQIYTHATNLSKLVIEVKMPVRINFFLQKNIKIFQSLAQEIDAAKLEIAKTYGRQISGESFQVPPENIPKAQQELKDLFFLIQEVNLHIFKLEDFEGIELTPAQFSIISFMIEE